jgi:hypothetical protein
MTAPQGVVRLPVKKEQQIPVEAVVVVLRVTRLEVKTEFNNELMEVMVVRELSSLSTPPLTTMQLIFLAIYNLHSPAQPELFPQVLLPLRLGYICALMLAEPFFQKESIVLLPTAGFT